MELSQTKKYSRLRSDSGWLSMAFHPNHRDGLSRDWVFRRYHVRNNPLRWFDPNGLFENGKEWNQEDNAAELGKWVTGLWRWGKDWVKGWNDLYERQYGRPDNSWETTPEERQKQIMDEINNPREFDKKVLGEVADILGEYLLDGTGAGVLLDMSDYYDGFDELIDFLAGC